MRDQGWYEKEGVKILEGKWQDFVDSEALLGVGGFDVVYTDTFSEDYKGQAMQATLAIALSLTAQRRPQKILRARPGPAHRPRFALQLLQWPRRYQ